jgi:hypothetical protein
MRDATLAPRSRIGRERRILIATAMLAVGVPAGAAAWVKSRTQSLADHLGTAGGVTASIGGIDADLTGAIRLSEVAFGDLVAADAIEASVALESLLSGQLRADEIRVAGPHVAIHVDADGDSDLARLARRLAHQGSGPSGSGARLRRIVVSSGTLTAHVAGIGDLSADGVELIPDADGVRVITGAVHVAGGSGPVGIELGFSRSAAELALPAMKFRRVLAVGGSGTVRAGDRTVALREVAAGRLSAGGDLEVHAEIDDGGIPRPLSVELSPRDLTVTLRGERVPLRALAAIAPRGLVVETARATGSLRVHRKGAAIELDADGSFDGLVIDHRAFAAEPVPISAQVRATVSVAPEAITVGSLAIDTGAVHASANGWLRRGSPISGQLDATLASAACADLLASLPAELRGPLDGMVLTGSLGGHARLAIDLAAPAGDGAVLSSSLTGGCQALAEPPAADVTSLTSTSEHTFADGSHALVGPAEPEWVPIRRMPSHLTGAFVSAEDGRFWSHEGFDLQQIAHSLEIDLRERRLARGGSTISQQLIKNAFLTQRRTFDRKIQEAILTWRLEARLDKKQILERYLNIIELGPHIFGIRPAAQHWFGESPHELTIRQSAFLAALTSEPTSMTRRIRRAGGLDPDSAERVAIILRAMRRDGVLSADEFDRAQAAPMWFADAALR